MLERVPEFEDTLVQIAPKSEILSNSSYDELKVIRDVFGDLMPVSKLVRFTEGGESPYLLRFVNGNLHILRYDIESKTFVDETSRFKGPNETLKDKVSYNYKKPDPLTVKAVVDINIQEGKVPKENGSVLMFGDRYLTDIIAGNLAGVDTARVKPYKPMSDTLDLIGIRIFDYVLGHTLSRIPSKEQIKSNKYIRIFLER